MQISDCFRPGIKLIESPLMVHTETNIVQRTWKERLLSWPWHPFKKYKVVITETPLEKLLSLDGGKTFLCHPSIAYQLREQCKRD